MSLKEKTIKGSVSTVAGQFVQFSLQMASVTILARLIAPEEYGKFAIATAISSILAIFASGGLSAATMQKPKLTQKESSSMFWLNVGLGFLLFLALCAAGPVVNLIYKDPDYYLIMPLLGFTAFVTSFSVQKKAILTREMKFGRIALANVISQLVGVSAAIFMGFRGFGIWALLAHSVIAAITHNIVTYFSSPWKPSFTYDHSVAKPMIKFGASVMLSKAMDASIKGLDTILLGAFFGSAVVGIYNRAQNILKIPLRKFINPIANVARAAIFRTSTDQQRFENGTYAIISLISVTSGFIVVGAISVAEPAILLLLGDQWIACIPLFMILSPSAFIEPTASFLSAVLIAKGDSSSLVKWRLISFPLLITGMLIGIKWGATGVAINYALGGILLRTPLYVWYTCKKSKIPFTTLTSYIVPSLTATLTCSIVPVYLHLEGIKLDYLQTAIMSCVCLIMYFPIVSISSKGRAFFRLVMWIRAKDKKNATLEQTLYQQS